MHEIQIDGCVSLPDTVSFDEFNDKFIEWLEMNGWKFGGGMVELDEQGEGDIDRILNRSEVCRTVR